MFKYPRLFAILAVVFSLCGCATVIPKFDVPNDPDNYSSTEAITDRVSCDIKTLMSDENTRTWLKGWVATLQLNLTTNDTGGLTPTATYMNGLFSFGGTAALSQSREQNFTATLNYDLDHLNAVEQNIPTDPALAVVNDSHGCPPPLDTNLAGEIGLIQTVKMGIKIKHLKAEKVGTGTDGAFGGYVNFVVTKSLSATGPTWTLKHFKGPGGLLGLSDVNTDKLIFSFARAAPGNGGQSKSGNGGQSKFANSQANLQFIILNQIATQLTVINNFSH